jgi:hypothetical protein
MRENLTEKNSAIFFIISECGGAWHLDVPHTRTVEFWDFHQVPHSSPETEFIKKQIHGLDSGFSQICQR